MSKQVINTFTYSEEQINQIVKEDKADIVSALKSGDDMAKSKLIIIALYKEFLRRGSKKEDAISFTKKLIDNTKIEIV